jgi:hypothetical protein
MVVGIWLYFPIKVLEGAGDFAGFINVDFEGARVFGQAGHEHDAA